MRSVTFLRRNKGLQFDALGIVIMAVVAILILVLLVSIFTGKAGEIIDRLPF